LVEKRVFILLVLRQTELRLVKRRRALVETNLSRNSQLVTHRSDEPGSCSDAQKLAETIMIEEFSRQIGKELRFTGWLRRLLFLKRL